MLIAFLITALLCFALVYAICRSGSTKAIGKRGERRVYSILTHLPDEYHLFNDIMLKTRNGRTMQIDHIVVSP